MPTTNTATATDTTTNYKYKDNIKYIFKSAEKEFEGKKQACFAWAVTDAEESHSLVKTEKTA